MSPDRTCQFCGAPLRELVIDLGEMPLANSYLSNLEVADEQRFPLQICVCAACLLVQISHPLTPETMFSSYMYFSSVSQSWLERAQLYAQEMSERLDLGPDSLVIEVASNDGYLLQHFARRGIPVLGIEPAANVAMTAIAKGVPTEMVFFGIETARRLNTSGRKADLIVANNVLAHVPDIRDFAEAIAMTLKPSGAVTLEFPHVLNLLRHAQFDTIYHEHFSYLSLLSVERIFGETGLKAIKVQELPTQGGSLRLYAVRRDSPLGEDASLEQMRAKEREARLDRPDGYRELTQRAEAARASFRNFLRQAKTDAKQIAAYGAAAKGNTFLNYCGVTHEEIECVFDRSPMKQGKLLPGSHIPIVTPERLSEFRPDYLVILAWNLAEEIREQCREIGRWGGRFVVAIPETRILS